MTEALLDVQDALDVLDRHDAEGVMATKHRAAPRVVATASMRNQYVTRAATLKAVAENAGGKQAKREKAKASAAGLPKGPVTAHMMQAGGHLWASNTRGEWHNHLPGEPRIHEPFMRAGGGGGGGGRNRLLAGACSEFGKCTCSETA